MRWVYIEIPTSSVRTPVCSTNKHDGNYGKLFFYKIHSSLSFSPYRQAQHTQTSTSKISSTTIPASHTRTLQTQPTSAAAGRSPTSCKKPSVHPAPSISQSAPRPARKAKPSPISAASIVHSQTFFALGMQNPFPYSHKRTKEPYDRHYGYQVTISITLCCYILQLRKKYL